MRRTVIALALALPVWLYIGYYRESGETQMYTYIFIKKHPTLQVRFENIFVHYRVEKKLSELTPKEREQVIDYCKYRLGIETELATQDELERCKEY